MTLVRLSREEKAQLGGFLGKNYQGNQSVTVSASAFQKALDDSRFAGIQLKELLEAADGGALVGKKEEREEKRRTKEEFFEALLEKAEKEIPFTGGTLLSGPEWLKGVLYGRKSGYQRLMQLYREDPGVLEKTLMQVLHAACALPVRSGGQKRLPVFAAEVTGNPHSFDENTVHFHLLSSYIAEAFGIRREAELSGPEWKNQVLYQAGILKDDLSNMVLACNVRGLMKDGRLHAGLEGYKEAGEPVQITLQTIGRLADAFPADEKDRRKGRVYVVENPAVFSALCTARPDICVVCGGGQPRLAALLLLDFLSCHGMLYYAGDFDPEGLVIAQNLKRRYGARLEFWAYRAEYYEKYCSDADLPQTSLKKLDKVTEEGLQEVKKAMAARGKAAYQEAMLEVLLAF